MPLVSVLIALFFSGIQIEDKMYDLHPRYQLGDVFTSEEKQTVVVSAPYFPGGSLQYQLTTRMRETVVELEDDGAMEIEVIILECNRIPESELTTPFDYTKVEGLPIRIRYNSQCVVTEVLPPDNLPEASVKAFRSLKQMYLNYGNLALYPVNNVAINEVWKNDAPMSIEMPDGEIDQIYTIRQSVIGDEQYEGQPVISIAMEGEFTGTIEKGSNGTLKGNVIGKRYLAKSTSIDCFISLNIDQQQTIITADGESTVDLTIAYERRTTTEQPVR